MNARPFTAPWRHRVALIAVFPLMSAVALAGIVTFFAIGQCGLARSFGRDAAREWRLAWNGDDL